MIISFQEAQKIASQFNVQHLMLGNGFSIACDPTIFTYNSLYNKADLVAYPEIQKAFDLLQTTDFELVVNALEHTATVIPAYSNDLSKVSQLIESHAFRIKELLIETIAKNHPSAPSEIDSKKFESCRRFLAHFVRKDLKGKIYSLNYDLLLYWTLMHDVKDEPFELICNDGFGKESYFENGELVVLPELIWLANDHQNIHYIHGALHFYDEGQYLEKFSWTNTGTRLIDQAKKALAENKFPLFVTEGDSLKKVSKIAHNPYLFNSHRSFANVANGGLTGRPGNSCLFTYGVSFAENDFHIFEKISKGRIKCIFISLYGDENSAYNKRIKQVVNSLSVYRTEFPLEVHFYQAESAKVWDNY